MLNKLSLDNKFSNQI